MYEGEAEQLDKAIKADSTPKSVPLTCDKCYHQSEVTFKECEKHPFLLQTCLISL